MRETFAEEELPWTRAGLGLSAGSAVPHPVLLLGPGEGNRPGGEELDGAGRGCGSQSQPPGRPQPGWGATWVLPTLSLHLGACSQAFSLLRGSVFTPATLKTVVERDDA